MPSFLPRKDAALLDWSSNFAAVTQAKFASLFLSQLQADAINEAQKDFSDALALLQNPATKNKLTVADKDAKRRVLLQLCGGYGRMLEAHPLVSDAQRIDLRLTIRKPPTPAKVPGVATVEVTGVSANNVAVRVHGAGPVTRGLPDGVAFVGIFGLISEELVLDFTRWTLMGNVGRTVTTIEFPAALAPGTRVWLAASYFNSRKVNGVMGAPVGVNLQGGGLSAIPTPMKLAA